MKLWKRYSVFLLAVMMILLLFAAKPTTVSAAEYTSGDYTYTLSNNQATITKASKALDGDIVIPSSLDGNTVVAIGPSVFMSNTSITSVVIPDSVTSIANYAFFKCSGITKITFGSNVTSIAAHAFEGCSGLKNVNIPDSVTSIGESAFRSCTRITSVTTGTGLTEIPGGCFGGCKNLKTVVIGKNVSKIASFAFENCSALSTINLDSQLKTISDYAFDGCSSLTSLIIPENVTSIGDHAFWGCKGLTDVTIGKNVKSIGQEVFLNCSALKVISIPDSVTSIGSSAFRNCTGLTAVTIGTGLTGIPSGCFANCPNLKTVTIGENVTTIGSGAFNGSVLLSTINWGSKVKTISTSAFRDCAMLASLIIPDTVTSIGDNAFQDCSGLTEVVIGKRVTSIGDNAFLRCSSIKKVYFPASLQTIDIKAFAGCNSISDVYYESSEEDWGYVTIKSDNTAITNTNVTYHFNYTNSHTHDYSEIVTVVPTCTEAGYTTYSCTCGESYQDDFITAFGHTYVKGFCTVCGTKDPNYVPEAFELYGSNMTLGNALDMNFFVYQSDIEGTGNYAVITKHYADGRPDAVVRVDQKNWSKLGSVYYYFTFSGVKAKEMADKIDVVIYNAEGEAISEVLTDSVQSYARRMLDKAETPAKDKSLYIEMLNYGAAAQVEFKYDTGNLVNSVITAAEQQAYGMKARTYVNQRQSDAAYFGTTLTLENQIVFNIFYNGSYIPEGAYAVASFTNHKGQKMEDRVNEFTTLGSWKYVSFKSLVVADCSEPITVKLYDTNGKLISTVVDSIEGYAARMTEVGPLYDAIMKFADTAYQYFHS